MQGLGPETVQAQVLVRAQVLGQVLVQELALVLVLVLEKVERGRQVPVG